MNVTQAAVAQQVRGVQLTEAGRRLAQNLPDGFTAIANGIADLHKRTASHGLRVTTTPFLTDCMIMPRLSEFWQVHPGVEISIFPGRALVDILCEEFDLAIRAIPHDASRNWNDLDHAHILRVSLIGIAVP